MEPDNKSVAFTAPDFPPPALIDQCVHCGFCLPTCPTYVLWGEEMDSPRGRIYLMKAGVEGRAALTGGMVRHFDRCLGCLACVTACPSGVQYAPLIEKTRAQIERHHERGPGDRLFRSLLMSLIPYPARMRVAMLPLAVVGGLVRRVGRAFTDRQLPDGPRRPQPTGETSLLKRIAAAMALSPPVDWRGLFGSIPETTSGGGRSTAPICVRLLPRSGRPRSSGCPSARIAVT